MVSMNPVITAADVAALTPSEVDSILAEIWVEREQATRSLLFYTTPPRVGSLPHNAETEAEKLRTKLARLANSAAPYEARYEAEKWDRYFIVQNNNGHVHRNRECTTCFPTTVYAWLPELSGCDEAAMVAEYGELACTVCFPDAPAAKGYGDGTSALARYSAAERAEREATKAAKAITNPDGTPLRTAGRWGDLIKTEVSARRRLSSDLENVVAFGYSDRDGTYAENFRILSEAIAAKVGSTPVEVLTEATAKVLKKHRLTAAEVGAHVLPAGVEL